MANLMHDFGAVGTEKLKRSTWLTGIRTKTALKQGALIPLGFYDVIPNSTIECSNVDTLIRLALTPLKPFFTDMYFTYGAYFVPYRILYRNYKNMFGNGKPSEWSEPNEYVMPMGRFTINDSITPTSQASGYDNVVNTCVNTASNGAIVSKPGNLADYLGLPLAISGGSEIFNINIAPFLAYERIWSDYWRDENFQNTDPDLEKAEVFASGNVNISTLRFSLHYANKFHDYLTSLLPNVCKGPVPQANIPLDTFTNMSRLNGGVVKLGTGSAGTTILNGSVWSQSAGAGVSAASGSNTNYITGTNLGISLNPVTLRNSFALLRAAERNARTGTRAMNEAMRGIFEAKAPAILDKAEFLGGNTIRLNLVSVPQTTDEAGKLGAFSSTFANTSAFKKTFDEPGLVMFVGTIRQKHDYPQAVDRYWRKSRRYDFFDPALAHISEQPIYKSEYSVVHDDSNDDVIGFQEAWTEYEKPISHITGYLRGNEADLKAWNPEIYTTSGESFSAGTYYAEPGDIIANATVDYNSSYDSFQFILDFNAGLKVTAPKPISCTPGLIDHIVA